MWAARTDQGSGRTNSYVQMNRLSLRNNRLKLETSGELPIILEESMEEHISTEWKQNWKLLITYGLAEFEK